MTLVHSVVWLPFGFKKSCRPSVWAKFFDGRQISQCFCYAQRTGRFGPANLDHHCEPFCNCSCHQFCSRSACNLFSGFCGINFMDQWPDRPVNAWTDTELSTVLLYLLQELFSRLANRFARPPLRQPYRCGYQCAFCEAPCTRADEGHRHHNCRLHRHM